MRKWTEEERARQAEKIREWQPWKKAGVKTKAGKARSRKNALKHGAYTQQMKARRLYLRFAREFLKKVDNMAALISPSLLENELIRNYENSIGETPENV